MKRSATKYLSTVHEKFVAHAFNGVRSPSSGAAPGDKGDVRTDHLLIECKVTGEPIKPARLPVFVQQMEKIAKEAWEQGRNPVLALRYYQPDSYLADPDGWVDLSVTLLMDLAWRYNRGN